MVVRIGIRKQVHGRMRGGARELFDPRYEIVSILGCGGMGTVYEAIQSDLGRPVAIKILSQSELKEEATIRFEREALAMSKLQHKGVAAIYSFGLWNKRPYIVMEFVQGKTLRKVLEESGKLSKERALKLISSLCEAIAHAHSAGIIHRDLKPENIMVLQDGDTEAIKVIDLGFARLVPQSGEQPPQKLTQTGFIVGSIGYMSPEECLGAEADARSDIYSIGVILQECLTGLRPFESTDTEATLRAHVNLEPIPISAVDSQLNDAALQSAIYKALKKMPEERYQSVEELLYDLHLLLSSCDNAQETSKKRSSIKQSSVSLAAICIAIITIIGMSFYSLFSKKPEAPRYDNLPIARALATMQRDSLSGIAISATDANHLAERLAESDKQLKDRSEDNLLIGEKAGAVCTSRNAHCFLASVYQQLHLPERAHDEYSREVESSRKMRSFDLWPAADWAYFAYELHDLDKARAILSDQLLWLKNTRSQNDQYRLQEARLSLALNQLKENGTMPPYNELLEGSLVKINLQKKGEGGTSVHP